MSVVTSEQVRAGRGWLGWTQGDLAKRAAIGLSTLRDFEADKRTPIANNIAAIRRALEDAGLRFAFDDSGRALGVSFPTPKNPQPTSEPDSGGHAPARTQRGQSGRASKGKRRP